MSSSSGGEAKLPGFTPLTAVQDADLFCGYQTDLGHWTGSQVLDYINSALNTFMTQSALNSTDLVFPYQRFNKVEFTQTGQKLFLSNAQLLDDSDMNMPIPIYNDGAFAFDVTAVDQTTVIYSKLMPGETLVLRCTSKLTTNGTWDISQVILSAAPSVNPQTGTTYTFTAADFKGNQTVTASNASAQTYTIPQNSITAIPVGYPVLVSNINTGTVTFALQGSDTATGNLTLAPGANAYIEKIAISGSVSTWRIGGVVIHFAQSSVHRAVFISLDIHVFCTTVILSKQNGV